MNGLAPRGATEPGEFNTPNVGQRPRRSRFRRRLRHLLSRFYRPVARVRKRHHSRPGPPHRIDRKLHWRGSSPLKRSVRILVYGGGLLLLGALAWAIDAVLVHRSFAMDNRCQQRALSCGILASFLVPVLTLALVSAFFLLGRLWYLRRRYLRTARSRPQDFVPTAGNVIGEVVGRDQLCRVMIADLRDLHTRRVHVVVGGIGTGKTALLVRLTKQLAHQRAVPVAVRLRDAQQNLDFRELARTRFMSDLETGILSENEGEKVWRQLLKEGRIVVLADGLEEALSEDEAQTERDNLIRLAIRQANKQELPLIVASRPHAPLRGTEAALVELEPLSEEAALDYIQLGDSSEDEQRIDWIVETAEVTETPLYMQIAHQLHRAGLLMYVSANRDGQQLDTRGVDRSTLRLRLLTAWKEALVNGHFPPGVALGREDRMAAIEYLSVLACIGLRQDSLQVKIEEFSNLLKKDNQNHTLSPPDQPPIIRELHERITATRHSSFDVRLAATWGMQLQLVEAQKNAVRFPHSILQAYLGSRVIGHAMADEGFRNKALDEAGRELLIALVLYSRAKADLASPGGPARAGIDGGRSPDEPANLCRLLCEAADKRSDPKAVDLYATALEIDSLDRAPQHWAIAEEIMKKWPNLVARDPRTLEHAKLNLVRRFGEAGRIITERRRHKKEELPPPAYSRLFEIGCYESSYAVRLAAAHEIGVGGDDALDELRAALGSGAPPQDQARDAGNRTTRAESGERRQSETGRASHEPGPDTQVGGKEKWQQEQQEDQTQRRNVMRAWRARLLGERDQPGTGRASHESSHNSQEPEKEKNQEEEETLRRNVMRAWLAPLLVESTTDSDAQAVARELLEQRLASVYEQNRRPQGSRASLSSEIALAQGFKYAANRRRGDPHVREDARAYLVEQAKEMLDACNFWFTKITLLHALTLWHLTDGGDGHQDHERDPDYKALVAHWCGMASNRRRDRRKVHPFVAEACRLSVRALETGLPERYIWIDESGVVSRVGSSPARAGARRKHNLWIPPSTGWTALNTRAQQLLADVLLLLNLAERGGPHDRNQRLQRTNRTYLPPCLAEDRSPLDPSRPLGTAGDAAPGFNCTSGCEFRLCPYPSKGAQYHRQELNEAFCRRQQRLLTPWLFRARTAPWQEMSAGQLRRFWKELGQPPSRTGHESDQGDRNSRPHSGR
jgi:NACHT domain